MHLSHSSISSSGALCRCTHILVDSVGMVKAKHPLTDDHGFQLDTASLESTESHSNGNNSWASFMYINDYDHFITS